MQNNVILYTFDVGEDVDLENRFIIQKTSNTLNTLDENLDSLNISTLKNKIEVLNLRDNFGVFKLFNLQGKEIINQSISINNPIISTKNISRGIYIIEIKSDNNFLRKKVVIQN